MSGFFGAMFEQDYIDRAMLMTKAGNFFWEPTERWHLAAQREYHTELYRQTSFSVTPIFFETRVEIWPIDFKIQNMRFKKPWPNIVMLHHDTMCVWNRLVSKPTDPRAVEMIIGVEKLSTEAIITIRGIDQSLCKELQRKWSEHKRLH